MDQPAPAPTTSGEKAADLTLGGVVRRLGGTGVLAIASVALPPLGAIVLLANLNAVGQWLRGHEALGVGLYIVGFILLTGLALLPTYATAILGGWAFGFALGYPAALCGFVGGAMLGYLLARRISGDRVVKLLDEKPAWRAVRDALVGSGFWRSLGIIALLRLPFNSPFAASNLVMAAVKTNVWAYLLGTLIGMAPRTGVVVYVAVQLSDQLAADAAKAEKPWWWWPAVIGVGLVVLVVISWIASRAVKRVTGNQRARIG